MFRTIRRLGPLAFDVRSLQAALGCTAAFSLLMGSAVGLGAQSARNQTVDPHLYQALHYRMVGPTRGGRVTTVTGVRGQPHTFYMGSTGGGVWRTTDAGRTWKNLTDDYFQAGSMGAVAVAESDPNVIYAGTGSACIRGNVSTGIGIYRSTDAGATWTHIGLRDAGQIGRILVDPKDPDLVYVAVLGHAFGPSAERGVYRSKDGGRNWENVLFLSDTTGAVDLSMDSHNPRVIYASMWRAERKPWTIISGAKEGGIYKTTDGGDHWTELTNGLPEVTGRVGVSVSPMDSRRVYAVVEAFRGKAGVYRSEDAGASWRLINTNETLLERPWYYDHIFADPQDTNTVYIAGEAFWRSVDGGETFTRVRVPHDDNHTLWINPDDDRIMIEGNDGGAIVSLNQGETWSSLNNQPTAEFYTLDVDDVFPYRIYGPQQDNTAMALPSRSQGTGITVQDWESLEACETGPVSVDPDDPDVVYIQCFGDGIKRFDRRTEQVSQVGPYPQASRSQPKDVRFRYQWAAPVLVSKQHAGTLYFGSQYVHRSTNQGQRWEVISPDLTRNDTTKQGWSGEPITRDMSSVEVYNTVFEIIEDPNDPNAIWAGSDDGLIHVSRDLGESWKDVTPKGLPKWSTVQTLDGSVHGAGRVFAAIYRYRLDDFHPYVYRTDDYGESWTLLTDGTNGIPADVPVRVVREDPDRKGLLYAGTEFGLYVSFDDGAHWQSLQLNLPHTPVTDLVVHDQDLVVATQGRGFWVLDDVTSLEQLGDEEVARAAGSAPHLFRPRDAYRALGFREAGAESPFVTDGTGGATVPHSYAGENPPNGAMIFYSLPRKPEDTVRLDVLDAGGHPVRSFSSATSGEDRLSTDVGLNRFVWDLRFPGVDGPVVRHEGPAAVPGSYQVRLSVGDWSDTEPFDVLKDPRISTTPADFEAQFDLLSDIRDRIRDINDVVATTRDVKEQIRGVADRLESGPDGAEIRSKADSLVDRLTDLEARLIIVPRGPIMGHQPRQVYGQLRFLSSYVSSADARPTDQDVERFRELDGWLDQRMEALESALDDVRLFNDFVARRGVGAVMVPELPGMTAPRTGGGTG